MLSVFTAHFSPVKCSKTIFLKKAKPLASYRGTIQSGNSIKCPRNASDTYISSISFLLQLSTNKTYIQVGFNHKHNPLTWRGYSLANVPCINFLHCPLSAWKCAAFDIQRQIWQYKVKHDRRWRKLPRF